MYFYIFDIEQLQKNKKNNSAKSYQVEVQGEGWGHAEEIIYFCWQRPGIPPEELVEVGRQREVWNSAVVLTAHTWISDRKLMDGWMDGVPTYN